MTMRHTQLLFPGPAPTCHLCRWLDYAAPPFPGPPPDETFNALQRLDATWQLGAERNEPGYAAEFLRALVSLLAVAPDGFVGPQFQARLLKAGADAVEDLDPAGAARGRATADALEREDPAPQ